jgi:hypothetical protein
MINKLNRKVLDKRDTRETHTSRVWREELAEMLEVNLRHREALKRGSILEPRFPRPGPARPAAPVAFGNLANSTPRRHSALAPT